MRRMLLMSKSLRMFLTEEYSLQSSGSPNALLASTVSKPSSCKCSCILAGASMCTSHAQEGECAQVAGISGQVYPWQPWGIFCSSWSPSLRSCTDYSCSVPCCSNQVHVPSQTSKLVAAGVVSHIKSESVLQACTCSAYAAILFARPIPRPSCCK